MLNLLFRPPPVRLQPGCPDACRIADALSNSRLGTYYLIRDYGSQVENRIKFFPR